MSIYQKLNDITSRVVTLEQGASSAVITATTASNFQVTNQLSGGTILASTLTASNFSASSGLANLTTVTASNFSASAGLANLTTLTASNLSSSIISTAQLTASNGINFGEQSLANYKETTIWSFSATGYNGTLSKVESDYTRIGNMIFYYLELSCGTAVTGTVGDYIQLPNTIDGYSLGSFRNRSDGIDLGQCFLASNKLYTPAFTAPSGVNLILTGFYRV